MLYRSLLIWASIFTEVNGHVVFNSVNSISREPDVGLPINGTHCFSRHNEILNVGTKSFRSKLDRGKYLDTIVFTTDIFVGMLQIK